MLVLSRQIDETLMIGDAILVTVVSISPEMTTLHVCYDDDEQHVEQKCALEIDDRIEITDEVHVSVVDIRGDKVRLAVRAPRTVPVHRKEVYEQLRRETRAAANSSPVELNVGERLRLGEALFLALTEVLEQKGTLHCSGLLVGGAEDGMPFVREQPISVGTRIEFGTLVRICVLQVSPGAISLRVEHPPLMTRRIEK